MMQHVAFLGDGEKTFALTTPMLEELERTTGEGVGKLFNRLRAHDFSLRESAEVIRLGLIGGGTAPTEAAALVRAYVESRPLVEGFTLAFAILAGRYFGTDEKGAAA